MTKSRSELTPFSHVILALVGEGGAGPHDLARMMRTGGSVYWSAARSQYYAEPRRLEKHAYLKSTKEPGQTTERTRYTLTAKGRRALVDWLSQPAHFPRIQSEPTIKLLSADLADDATVLHSLRGLRSEIADISARLEEAEANAASLQHRVRYLRLNHHLARAILHAHLDWLDAVEEELGEH